MIVIGGNSAHTLAKRLAPIARQRWRRLRVVIGTPERMPDPKALTLFVPSYNRDINRWLDRSGVSGVVNALDGVGSITSLRPMAKLLNMNSPRSREGSTN